VTAQAMVPFKGNWYSIGPGRGGDTVTVVHRLGSATLDIVSAAGVSLARHHREPDHAGKITRSDEHVTALEHAVLARSPIGRPVEARSADPRPRSRGPRPPRLAASTPGATGQDRADQVGGEVVVDFSRYAAAAQDRARPTTNADGPA